ncbi:MAG TPA: tRNA dihydrouridine synthase DusB [Dissulfurispiraceae bacterium]
MFTIGNVPFSSCCILAPMAGISDLPFRTINRAFGCTFAYTEMISARALVYGNKNTLGMLTSSASDRPLGVQLLGDDPRILREAMAIIREFDFDIVDFNAACPVGKVAGRGEGASLLKDPRKLRDLLKVLVGNSAVPVTVKIRAGWDDASPNAREIALHAQEAGIKGLCIHGRTKVQGYSGRVDYRIIREVKEALDIPVIASGDALSPQLIKKMFDETGCDGVAIARGALGNPWIFRQTEQLLNSGTLPPTPGGNEIADAMNAHLASCLDYYGETVGTVVFRKFFAWYVKGLHEIRTLKEKAFLARTKRQMTDYIEEARSAARRDSFPRASAA